LLRVEASRTTKKKAPCVPWPESDGEEGGGDGGAVCLPERMEGKNGTSSKTMGDQDLSSRSSLRTIENPLGISSFIAS